MTSIEEVERGLRELGAELVAVHEGECLSCYLERMTGAYGCDGGLRFTERWRAVQPIPLPALVSWLRANGGYCDCEVGMNVFANGREGRPAPQGAGQRFPGLRCPASYAREEREG